MPYNPTADSFASRNTNTGDTTTGCSQIPLTAARRIPWSASTPIAADSPVRWPKYLKYLLFSVAPCVAAFSTPAVAQVTHLPSVPQPSAAHDVVGFNFQNPGGVALPAQLVTFGEVFATGTVQKTDSLQATLSTGEVVPVQMDAKSTYPDGSVKFAVVTVKQPGLAAGQVIGGMLQTGGPTPGTAVNLDALATKLRQVVKVVVYSSAVPATFSPAAAAQVGTASTVYDLAIGPALHKSLTGGSPDCWLQGPLVTQCRVDIPVAGSLHAVFDISSYNMSRNHIVEDMQLRNDYAMTPNGGVMTYDVSTNFNGQKIHYSQITEYQYQAWHQVLWSSGPPVVNVQHDILALEKTGAIPSYSVKDGVDASLIAGNAGFAQPALLMSPGVLNNDGITMYMGQTGGRCDVSFVSCVDAEWLMTQDPQAAANALGWADAAGAIAWHYWSPAHGRYIN
ncbi:MAG TPA: hypothetical protein VME47_23390, partial [Acetobacteraceae bacterium]|nr:hypothetical protein [Acetobacteraceae bacterium]